MSIGLLGVFVGCLLQDKIFQPYPSLFVCGSLNICQYPLPRATIYQNYLLFENLYNIAEIGLSLALNTNQSINPVLVINIAEIPLSLVLNTNQSINHVLVYMKIAEILLLGRKTTININNGTCRRR